MNSKTKRDLISFLVFLLFGIVLWLAIPILIPGKEGFQIDSRLFPRMISILFMVIGGGSAIMTWLKARGEDVQQEEAEETPQKDSIKGLLQVVAMAVIMVAYALLIEPIGFIPTTFLAVTAVLLLERAQKVSYYIAVYAACIALYCIFKYLLFVQL